MRVIVGVDELEVAERREQPPGGGAPPEGAPLTDEEEAGLRSALDAAGHVMPAEEVRRRLELRVARGYG